MILRLDVFVKSGASESGKKFLLLLLQIHEYTRNIKIGCSRPSSQSITQELFFRRTS